MSSDEHESILIDEALATIARPVANKDDIAKKRTSLFVIFIFFLSLMVSYFLLSTDLISIDYLIVHKLLFEKGLIVIAIILTILFLTISISIFYISKIEDPTPRFYANKILHFFSWITILLFLVSSFFSNWTTLFTSLGLISVVFGIALQAPVSNFFAWIILIVSPMYRVGDRVKIGDATGDVIDIGYLYTTLWEFGGDYVSSDLPSGRIITLPNSQIFNVGVYNYSWPLFPYIWSEISFYIAYDADFDFVEKISIDAAFGLIGEKMKENIKIYRKVLASTPVDDLEVKDEPRVFFTADSTTWIKTTVRFLAEPKKLSKVKKHLLLEIIGSLSKFPEKVRFPKGDSR